MTGGFGVHAMITNIGDAPAKDLTWEIELEGEYIITNNGPIPPWPVIPELPAGESIIVDSWRNSFIFGFGDVEITISAYCQDGSTAQ